MRTNGPFSYEKIIIAKLKVLLSPPSITFAYIILWIVSSILQIHRILPIVY